jgi:hypothetical protein
MRYDVLHVRPTLLTFILAIAATMLLSGCAAARRDGTIATGRFGTAAWRLSATDAADGTYCVTMTLRSRSGGGGTSCGSIFGRSVGQAHGISFLDHVGRPAPDYIVGPVTATAKTVVITLSNGTTLQTKAIAPPRGMTAKIAFYVTQHPCPADATHLHALNSKGRPVAHLTIPLLPPSPTCVKKA